MKTLSAIVPNADSLILERHVITVDETTGLNHSINGEHRAHTATEHATDYIAALPFADLLREND